MMSHEFIDNYAKLTPEMKDRLDEAIQLRTEKLENIAQLEEKFKNLTAEEVQDLESEEEEFQKRMDEEEREIDEAEYATDDPEEAATLREIDWANLRDERYEVLTTTFPIGIHILEGEIEHLEEEMVKLLPAPKMPHDRFA